MEAIKEAATGTGTEARGDGGVQSAMVSSSGGVSRALRKARREHAVKTADLRVRILRRQHAWMRADDRDVRSDRQAQTDAEAVAATKREWRPSQHHAFARISRENIFLLHKLAAASRRAEDALPEKRTVMGRTIPTFVRADAPVPRVGAPLHRLPSELLGLICQACTQTPHPLAPRAQSAAAAVEAAAKAAEAAAAARKKLKLKRMQQQQQQPPPL